LDEVFAISEVTVISLSLRLRLITIITETLIMAYPKSRTGPWTLDSGLWTLDFSSQNFTPPEKNLYISPHKTSLPPKKNLPPNKKFNYIGFLIESD